MPVRTECRIRLQTTSSESKLQLECGLWAGDSALRSRIPGVSTYSGVQETSGLWESVVETLWEGANSTLCSGILRLWPSFLLESELFLLPLDLYFKFRTACFLSSIQNSPLKYFLDSIFSTISSYASLLKKPLKESSTISPKWKFTWLSQITTNQASSKKELQKLFTKEWEDQ